MLWWGRELRPLQKTVVCCNYAWWCCGFRLAAMVCCPIMILHLFMSASVYTCLQTAEYENRWHQCIWTTVASWVPILPNYATNFAQLCNQWCCSDESCVNSRQLCLTCHLLKFTKQKLLQKAAPRGNTEKLGSTQLNLTQDAKFLKEIPQGTLRLGAKLTWLSPAAFPDTHSCCIAPGWLLWPVPAG